MYALAFVEPGVAGQGEIRKQSVSVEQVRTARRYDRFQSVVKSGDRLAAVGAFGAVAVSADDGATWRRMELPGAPGLIRAAACGDGVLLALSFDGVLWRGGKEGASWDPVTIPAKDVLLDMTCTADNRVWVVGSHGALMGSADLGRTWIDKSLDEDLHLLNVQFPTGRDGVVTGEFGRVIVTRDGGAAWVEAGSLGADFYPQGMDFRDPLHGVVVGLGGAVQDTEDGGLTWTRSQAPTEAPLYGVIHDGPDRAVIVGAAGSAFVRAAGGWREPAGAPRADLRGVAVTQKGLAAAGAGFLGALAPPAAASGAK